MNIEPKFKLNQLVYSSYLRSGDRIFEYASIQSLKITGVYISEKMIWYDCNNMNDKISESDLFDNPGLAIASLVEHECRIHEKAMKNLEKLKDKK